MVGHYVYLACSLPGVRSIEHEGDVGYMYQMRVGCGSSVGRARDSWSGGPEFDSRCGRPLPTGWVGVSIM